MHEEIVCRNDLTIGKLVKEYIDKNKGIFILYVLFVLIMPLQDIGLPHLFGNLTKAIQQKKSLVVPIVMIICVIFILQIGYSLADQVDIKMFPTIQKFVREKMMMHLFEMQKTNYEELKIGEITTKIIKMPALMYSYMEHWKNLYIPQALVFTIAVIYFMWVDRIIGITLLILVLSLAYMIYSSINVCEMVAKKRDSVYNALYEEVDDVLRNVVTVLNYNMEEGELERIDRYHKQYTELSKDALKCAMRVRYLYIPLISIYLIFFTYYLYNKSQSKKLELASFVSLFLIMIYLTNSMWRIIGNVKDVVLKWGMIQETLDMFKVCQRYKDHVKTDIPTLPGILLNNINYSFLDENNSKRILFEGLNIHFKPKERVLIVGQIGSGKTTILKLLMKYIEPTGGEIYINNIPYNSISPSDLRTFVGYIPQTPILFNRSIYENITYGMPHISKTNVSDMIYELGLEDIFSKLPNGMDTNVGKYGSKLSGGQRQIVWIIRTIIQNPDIVLLDEPTSAIDEKTKDIVHNLLKVVMRGKTIIMVTHDPFLKQFADRVIELKHGAIVNDYAIQNK